MNPRSPKAKHLHPMAVPPLFRTFRRENPDFARTYTNCSTTATNCFQPRYLELREAGRPRRWLVVSSTLNRARVSVKRLSALRHCGTRADPRHHPPNVHRSMPPLSCSYAHSTIVTALATLRDAPDAVARNLAHIAAAVADVLRVTDAIMQIALCLTRTHRPSPCAGTRVASTGRPGTRPPQPYVRLLLSLSVLGTRDAAHADDAATAAPTQVEPGGRHARKSRYP